MIKMTDDQFIESRKAGKTYKQIAEEFGLNVRTVERRAARLARQGKTDIKGAPGFAVVRESVLTRAMVRKSCDGLSPTKTKSNLRH